MKLTSVLLPLDDSPRCERRMRFALSLARAHESHMIGLACADVPDLPVNVDGAASLVEYADIARRATHERNERAAHAFRVACASAPPVSFEVIEDESPPAVGIVRHSHSADLVVLSQPDPASPRHAAARATVEEVVLNNPRPTLLLPYAGNFDAPMGSALIAWDGSREVARAVADSLPLLRQVAHVQLLAWVEGSGDVERLLLRSRLDTVVQWLSRHHIQAMVRVEPLSGVSIADAILSRVADIGADLIVMGAYGHARWRESVLGGATRGILTSMTAPVLMSH